MTGSSLSTLADLVNGKHPFSARLKAAKRPLIIVGAHALDSPDTLALSSKLAASISSAPDWKVHSCTHIFISYHTILDGWVIVSAHLINAYYEYVCALFPIS